MRIILQSDGAARGNPGPAAAGIVLSNAEGQVIHEEGKVLGRLSNNEAEYRALLLGLERAHALGVREIDIRLDSELLTFQVQGHYRVRAANLLPLYQQVKRQLARFDHHTIRHVPRALNARADRLANEALDREKQL